MQIYSFFNQGQIAQGFECTFLKPPKSSGRFCEETTALYFIVNYQTDN